MLFDSEQAIDVVSRKVFGEHPDAEIKEYLEIEIVAPTERMQALRKANDLEESVSTFLREVFCRIQTLAKKGHKLPSDFEVCHNFESGEDYPDNDYGKESHFGCLNCTETIRLIDMTPTSLYEKYHGDWEKAFPQKRYIDPKLVNSRAKPASNKSNLFEAVANFGHHSAGIELVEVNFDNAESYLNDRVLFFFHRLREIDSTSIQTILTEATSAKKKHDKENQERLKKNYEKEDQERVDAVIAFFSREH